MQAAGRIDTHLCHRFGPHTFIGRKKLGDSIERGFRQSQSFADIAQCRTRAVAHHVGDHGGAVAAIFLINMLDHFFAPVMLDIEIDIRRFGAFCGNKAFE